MALYELRTYTLYVGKMAEVVTQPDFMAFAVKLRPSIMTQEVKLLLAAPWGPHP
jgi:hypothetical protein